MLSPTSLSENKKRGKSKKQKKGISAGSSEPLGLKAPMWEIGVLETQTEPSRVPAPPGLRAWIPRKCHSAEVLLTLAFQESQVEKFLPGLNLE